jgi:DNA (cytosine-5)-methyltransferase 1
MLTAGSLFSGTGGFDLGLERAGMRVLWQVEKDEHCRRVLRRHWPDVAQHEDVCNVGPDLAPVDLICGGFPCQDLSVAGRRAGLAGERSGLFHEFMRIVASLAPRWVLVENVPGLLSSNGGRDMGTVLGTLGQLGYWWTWRVLDSQFFGVPQRRRRVFIVGHLGAPCPPKVLLEPESLPGDPPTRGTAGEGVAAYTPSGIAGYREGVGTLRSNGGDCGHGSENILAGTLGGGAGSRGWSDDTDRMTFVADPIVAGYAKGASNNDGKRGRPQNIVAHTLRADGFDASEDGTGRGTPLVAAFDVRNVTSKANRTRVEQGLPTPTLHANGLQVIEPAPDDWTRYDDAGKEIADGPRYRMLGNAVTVNVAEWIARRIGGGDPFGNPWGGR